MKKSGLMGLAAVALSIVSIGNSSAKADADLSQAFIPNKRGKGQRNRRGTGKQAMPKKRSNKLIVSKRARRKHRRAGK